MMLGSVVVVWVVKKSLYFGSNNTASIRVASDLGIFGQIIPQPQLRFRAFSLFNFTF